MMNHPNHPNPSLARQLGRLARRLYPVAMMVLAVAIGSTLPLAQAQQPTQPVIVTYVMDFGNAKTAICVGEAVTYHVRIIARVLVPGHPEAGLHHVTGVSLTQTFDPSIFEEVTNAANKPPITALFADVPLDITYQLKAIAPGRTSVDFAGTVQIRANVAGVPSTYPVADSLQVRVVPCQIKVVSITRFTQAQLGINVKGIAILYNGYLHGDAEGYYTGEADVVYMVTASIQNCGYSNTLNVGKATLYGRLTVDDQLNVDVTFLPVLGAEALPCTGGAIGPSMTSLAASPLKITVSIMGGSANPTHTISTLAGRVSGTANVSVFIEPMQ